MAGFLKDSTVIKGGAGGLGGAEGGWMGEGAGRSQKAAATRPVQARKAGWEAVLEGGRVVENQESQTLA